jgi:DNA mismatch repair protein MutS2
VRWKKVVQVFPPAPPEKGSGPVAVGDEVHVHSLGVRGSVTEILAEGREAEVLSGGIRMRIPVEYLSALEAKDLGEKGAQPTGGVSYDGSGDAPSEINLIGTTVEDALQSLDKHLDRSVLGPGRSLRIVHGKGTGALKKAVNKALEGDPRVSAFGPAPLDQGGAGVTIVELKD